MSGEGPSPARIDPFSRTTAALADGLLVFFPALAIAGVLRLPMLASPGEIVSATTRVGFNPLTNYLQLGLCAAVAWIAFVLGYRRGVSLLQRGLERLRDRSALAWTLAVAALVVFIVNIASSNVTGPLADGFHEGEYLGFVPMFAQGVAALPSAFTVHGPGVDFLPAYVTARFGDPDHGIVLTRSAYATLRSVAVVASLLVVAALAWLVTPTRWALATPLAFMLFCAALQIGAWPDEPALHKPLNARDAGYLLQLFVVLLFAAARRRRPDAPWSGLMATMVAGASIGWAVAYSYDRGLYGIAFLVLASIAFGLCGWTWLRTWLAGLALGAAIGGASLYALVGATGIEAIASQIAFWMRHGQVIWSYAGIVSPSSSWPVALLGGALAVMALAIVRVARSNVRDEIGVVLLLAASLAPLRMAIERADASHVAWAVTPEWILISVLAAAFVLAAIDRGGEDRSQGAISLAPVLMVALSALAGMSLVQLNPVAAWQSIDRQYVAGLRTSDRQILSASQVATMGAMAELVRSDACFYTLTNEGTWYYLMRKPSCSRFYQVTNARPVAAQREVVASLQAKAPSLILFESGGWSNIVDGISLFNASPVVARHVLSHYVPDKVLGDDNWIWRRAEGPPRFSGKRVESIVDAPREVTRAWDARISGSLRASDLAPPAALFVTDGANVPVWAGRLNRVEWAAGRWSATIPTAALDKGSHRLRVWAFADPATAMAQLGDDVEVVVK